MPVAGALDPSFGVDGIAAFHTSQLSHDLGNDVLLQPDGKIVVAGNAEAFASNPWPMLARQNTDGSLDNSFASDGIAIVTVPNSSSGGFSKVLRQPDGKFVAVGTTWVDSHPHFLLTRLLEDGTLDSTFGDGGIVVDSAPGFDAYGAALQPDGKIVVAGAMFRVQRYNTDGTLDTTFSDDGTTTVDLGPTDPNARAVVIQSDGKIVVCGSSSSSSGNFSFVVVRFNTDGTFDATFDQDGIVRTAPPNTAFQSANDIVQLADGKLLAAGTVGLGANFTNTPTLLRYNTDGSLDTTFDGDGYVISYLGNYAGLEGVAVQPDGKIVAVGSGVVGGPIGWQSIVLRYNADGTLDDTFGPADQTVMPGVVWTDMASPSDNDGFASVALAPDGKIVAAGTAGGGTVRAIGVARYFGDNFFAFADQYGTDEDIPLHVDAPGVLANDTIINGNPQAVLAQAPAHAAQFQLNADGSFDYTPAANFHGTDSFTYLLVEGFETSREATVTLTIGEVNDPPGSMADAYHVPLGDLFVSAAGGVLANDSDPEGDPLTAVLVTPPTVGQLTLNADGSFVFSGFPTDFVGSTTFTYKANDGVNDGPPTVVTLTRHVGVAGGILKVIGTSGSDSVRVQPAEPGGMRVILSSPGLVFSEWVPRRSLIIGVDVRLGDGDDRVEVIAGLRPVTVVGGAGNDMIKTGLGADTVYGDDESGLGSGSDIIDAGGGRNTVSGGAGDNVIRTGGGADTITTGDGRQDISSGAGNDIVVVGTGGSFIDAGAGNDRVTVGGGTNMVFGGSGNDVLIGGAGIDYLFGEGGNDLIVGGLGDDQLDGGFGNDILFDGQVAVVNPATDTLAKVLASYVPSQRSSLRNITSRLAVTFDPAGADNLAGGPGVDWFWTNDSLDLTDRRSTEPLNAIL